MPVRYLADCNTGTYGSPLSQYVYEIPMLSPQKMGKPLCIGPSPIVGSSFSKLIYSNSLLNWFIPVDLDGQDFIKI